MKKYLHYLFIAILSIFLLFTKTTLGFADTLYSNDLTNNINGWTPIDGTYDSPTFSSSGMTNLQIPYTYSPLNFQGQQACISADMKIKTPGGDISRMGLGFAANSASGYDRVTFGTEDNKV